MISDVRGAIAHVKSSLDIAKVVGDELGAPTKTGQDTMWCCPFHGEKTPSFSAYGPMQIYHCFGCGKSGDVVGFISNYKGMSTMEAVRHLVSKYAIDIADFERPASPEELRRHKLESIYQAIATHCSNAIYKNQSLIDSYKAETGFDDDTIIDYGVGYSNNHDSIINVAYGLGATEADVTDLELYSRLMWDNSLVYPIRTTSGQVVRFHNKPLSPPGDFGGKYVGNNTKNPLFANGVLFGAHLLNKANRSRIAVFEGQKAAMAGRGVALLGSSVHNEQIELLRNIGVQTAVFMFDGDTAGRGAADKIFLEQERFTGLVPLVGKIPDSMQPDDLVRTFGKEALDSVANSAVTPLENYIESRANPSTELAQKTELLHSISHPLSKMSDANLELAAVYLSSKLGVSSESVIRHVSELKTNSAGLSNADAEHSIFKAVLTVPRYWSTVKQSVYGIEYLTVEQYRPIYTAIAAVHDKSAKLGINADDISLQSIIDQLGGQSTDVVAIVNREAAYSLNESIFKVVDLYKRRAGIDQGRELGLKLRDGSKTTVQILSEHRKKLVSTLDYKKDTDSSPDTLAAAVEKELQARSLITSSIIGHDFSKITDVDGRQISCLDGLCLALSGLQKQHQVIISAQSGVGKSILGVQMATALAVSPKPADQVPVLWIPLEMNKIEISMRIISLLTGVNNTLVQTGKFSSADALRVKAATQKIASSQLYIHRPSNPNVEELFAVIDEHKFKYGVEAVFLDYIQMTMAGPNDRGAKREEVIGRASKMMKFQVAEDMGVVSVCIAQQNRSNYEEGDTGNIQGVGGSYQISQDADDFMIIANKTNEQMANENGLKGNRKIFLDKRRGGQSDVIIDLNLDDTKDVSLRFTECISIEKMTGLQGLAK